jgi:hypothetical protein
MRVATRELTSLDDAVVETVAYSDVFDFPLTPEEVRRWLPLAASRQEVQTALDHLGTEVLATVPPYVTLRGREHIIVTREQRRSSSRILRRRAVFYGSLMARLPFVRMVAITGSLAVENAAEGEDLDYLIVTVPGRVWLTRAMTMLVVRLAALRGITLCPNYFLSESVLAMLERNYYTARELLQMVPLAGRATHRRMLLENAWWRDYLPNVEPPPVATNARPEAPSLARRLAEAILLTPLGDLLESWLLRRKGAELRNLIADNDEAVFDETMCKGHFDGHRQRTEAAVKERLQRLTAPV